MLVALEVSGRLKAGWTFVAVKLVVRRVRCWSDWMLLSWLGCFGEMEKEVSLWHMTLEYSVVNISLLQKKGKPP